MHAQDRRLQIANGFKLRLDGNLGRKMVLWYSKLCGLL